MGKILDVSEKTGGVLMAVLRTPAPLLFECRGVGQRDRDPAFPVFPVMVGIIFLKKIEGAFSAGDINALA